MLLSLNKERFQQFSHAFQSFLIEISSKYFLNINYMFLNLNFLFALFGVLNFFRFSENSENNFHVFLNLTQGKLKINLLYFSYVN